MKQVDLGRAVGDPFKLTPSMLGLVTTRLATCKAMNAAAVAMDGLTVGASSTRQTALDRLSALLRSGYNGIVAIDSDDITDAERAQVFAAYGWEQGLIGDMSSPLRIEAMANTAVEASADPVVPAQGKYPAPLVTRITNQLAILEAASAVANGGSHQVAVAQRRVATDDLMAINSRVRLAYCSASDDGESTPELAKINMQPKRAAGDAQPDPYPDAAGTATYDNLTRELSIAVMPDHGTSIRAYRQAAGGPVELAGFSGTTTVSVVDISPVTPGVPYQAWVAARNSRGDGPISNKISFIG
jgi:hypothetical protein